MKRETVDKDCYNCKYFSEYKEPRSFPDEDYSVFGSCFKYFFESASHRILPICVLGGCCEDWEKEKA